MDEKKARFSLKPFSMLFLVLLIISVGAFFLLPKNTKPSDTKFIAPAPTGPSPTLSPETSLLVTIAVWYPSAGWSAPKTATKSTAYGNLKGQQIKSTVTSATPTLGHFEDAATLEEKGFSPDTGLSADGPGSSVWGYKKSDAEGDQVIIFSYRTKGTSQPNEPIQFNCPCNVDLSVFVSEPFSKKK